NDLRVASGGTLSATSFSLTGSLHSLSVEAGGTMNVTGNLSISASGTRNIAGTLNVGGNVILSGNGNLNISGGGTLNLTGNLSATGTATVTSGASSVVSIGGKLISQTASGNLTATFNASSTVTIGGRIETNTWGAKLTINSGVISSNGIYIDGGTEFTAKNGTKLTSTNDVILFNNGMTVTFETGSELTINGTPSSRKNFEATNIALASNLIIQSGAKIRVNNGSFKIGGSSGPFTLGGTLEIVNGDLELGPGGGVVFNVANTGKLYALDKDGATNGQYGYIKLTAGGSTVNNYGTTYVENYNNVSGGGFNFNNSGTLFLKEMALGGGGAYSFDNKIGTVGGTTFLCGRPTSDGTKTNPGVGVTPVGTLNFTDESYPSPQTPISTGDFTGTGTYTRRYITKAECYTDFYDQLSVWLDIKYKFLTKKVLNNNVEFTWLVSPNTVTTVDFEKSYDGIHFVVLNSTSLISKDTILSFKETLNEKGTFYYRIKIKANDYIGYSDIYTVAFDKTFNDKNQKLCIYPNIIRKGDFINISNIDKTLEYTIELIDTYGNVIYNKKIKDFSSYRLSPILERQGMYYLKIYTPYTIEIFKVIIQ
ncbi:MAG: T9SS type A sorting domain-containing protein, partial [Bacteroidales bacterium]